MGEQNLLGPRFGSSIIFIVISWLLIFWMLGDLLMTAGLLLLIAAGTGFAQVVTRRRKRGVEIKDAFWAETYAMVITLGLLLLLGLIASNVGLLLTYQTVLIFAFPLIFAHSIFSRWLRKVFSGQKTSWPHEVGIAVGVSLLACLVFLAVFSVSVNIMESQAANQLSNVPLPTNLDLNLSDSREYLLIQTDLADYTQVLNDKVKRVRKITQEMQRVCLIDCDQTHLLELAPSMVDIIVEYEQLNDAALIAFSTSPNKIMDLEQARSKYEICSKARGKIAGLPLYQDLTLLGNRIDALSYRSPTMKTFRDVMENTVFWSRIQQIPKRVDSATRGRTELLQKLEEGIEVEESEISKKLRYQVLLDIIPSCN